MRRLSAPSVVLPALLSQWVAGLAAQQRTCDLVESRQARAIAQPDGRVNYVSQPRFLCSDGARIEADSSVTFEATFITQLYGSVRFRDGIRELLSDRAQYYSGPGRLEAQGSVRLTDLSDGSVVTGQNLIMLQAGRQRPEDDLTVRGGRPHARFHSKAVPVSEEPRPEDSRLDGLEVEAPAPDPDPDVVPTDTASASEEDFGPLEANPAEAEPEEVDPAEAEPQESDPAEPEPEEADPAEAEPEESNPAEPEPEEADPAEPEPEEADPAEPEPEEADPAEPEPEETDPAEAEPEESNPAEAEPEESNPAEAEPEESDPAEAEPEETNPAEAEPEETDPAEAEPEESNPTEAEPEESDPTEAEPEETNPAEAEPEEANPTEAEPEEADPTEVEPEEADPAEPEPEEADPAEVEPEEADPAEAEPEESNPAEAEPQEADPAEAEPEDAGPFDPGAPDAGTVGPPPPPGPPQPFEVDADLIRLLGDRLFQARGRVEVRQDSLRLYGDSMQYGQDSGVLTLYHNARVLSPDPASGDTLHLSGDTIDMRLPNNRIDELEARGRARLLRGAVDIRGPVVRLLFAQEDLDRIVSVVGESEELADSSDVVADDASPAEEPRDPSDIPTDELTPPEEPADSSGVVIEDPFARPWATAEDFTLTGDSVEVRAPGGELESVFAAGSARGISSAQDSLNSEDLPELIRHDWIEGQEITATFTGAESDSTLAPDTELVGEESRYRLDMLVAQGAARSFYRSVPNSAEAPEEEGGPRVNLNYVLGDEIRLFMRDGQVDRMEVDNPTGTYLQAQPLPDTIPGDTIPGDTLRPPPDTIPADTLAPPPPDTASARTRGGSPPLGACLR